MARYNDDAEVGVDQVKLDQDQVKRQEQHCGRKHLRDEDPVEHGASAKKAKPGESVAAGRSQGDAGQRNGERNQGRIEEPAQKWGLSNQDAEIIESRVFRNHRQRG